MKDSIKCTNKNGHFSLKNHIHRIVSGFVQFDYTGFFDRNVIFKLLIFRTKINIFYEICSEKVIIGHFEK